VDAPDVFKLRCTAQHLADSMRNFTATETFVLDGWQRWRRQGGRKFYDAVPLPRLNGFIVSSDEWSELTERDGTDLNVKIQQ
jgi:hypothetical protein